MNRTRPSLLALLAIVVSVGAAQQWWAQRAGSKIGAEVAKLAQPGDIRMLSSETCGYCVQARAWFSANQVPFTECFVERDAACRAEMQALRAPGTPVIVVRGQAQSGFSAVRVEAALRNRG